MKTSRYAVAGGAAILAALLLTSHACQGIRSGAAHSYGSVTDSYLLAAPYRLDLAGEAKEGEVDLIDRNGLTVHAWKTQAPVLAASLEQDGSLYVSMTPTINQAALPGPGATGLVQQLDWDGKVLWQHEDSRMTMDIEPLPDGSVAYLPWDEAPQSFSSRAQGGFAVATSSMWVNDIVVVNREGSTTWEWRMADAVDPARYRISGAVPRQEFSHANALRFIEDNPITHTPAFLLSARHISTVFLIELATKKILWESPQGLLALQHDATITPQGNLLVFDNGFGREGVATLLSRVLELALPSGATVWHYDGGATLTSKGQFASSIMGGAQRLENGNTLVTVSASGRVQEVTPEGKTVWEYVRTRRDADGESSMLFRTRLYTPHGTDWGGKAQLQHYLRSLACVRL